MVEKFIKNFIWYYNAYEATTNYLFIIFHVLSLKHIQII